MPELNVLYAVLGVAAVLLALASRRARDLPLSEPLVALVLGVLVGPAVLGWLTLTDETRDLVLLEGSRLLLAGSVMAAALRYPVRSLRPILRAAGILLLVAMPLAAVLTGAVAMLAGLPLALAAVVGACLCPTDPVLASSVVTGTPAERDLPGRLRRLLTTESGANDGLALPLVGLAVAAALPGTTPADAVGRLAWEVLGGVAIGGALGALAAWGVRRATAHGELEPGPELVVTLLLAVATLGVALTARTGGVLAVFVAGLAYNLASGREDTGDDHDRTSQDRMDEAVNRYAVMPLFAVLGAGLPWEGWRSLGGGAVVALVAGSLLLRRPPVVVALARPLGLRSRDALFTGWFGPVGLSAVFYLAHAGHEGVTDERVFAAGTLVVAASVLAFGLTSAPGRRAYAAR